MAELSNATVHTFHYSIHTPSAYTRMISELDLLLNRQVVKGDDGFGIDTAVPGTDGSNQTQPFGYKPKNEKQNNRFVKSDNVFI